MLRYLIILVCVTSYASCANRDVYKNCTQIDFCRKFRGTAPTSLFEVDLDNIEEIDDNVYRVPLSNSDKQELYMDISLQQDKTARTVITEKNNTRYQLADVLASKPVNIKASKNKKDSVSVVFKPTDETLTHGVMVYADGTNVTVYISEDIDNSDGIALEISTFIFDTDSKVFAFTSKFNQADRLYGLHHHPVNLELPNTKNSKGEPLMDPYRNRNADNDRYEVGSPMAVYGTVPVIYGHSQNYTRGVFLHNAAEQWVDIWRPNEDNSAMANFIVESGTLDLFVLVGNTPKEVVRQYTGLTGVAHMPQLWTLGYHQCRWSYLTQDDVETVVAEMDANGFPMDAIWLDIDYTDGKRYFTWNPQNFSDPKGMQENLASTNKKLVTILDPHIKVDENYAVYAQAKNKHFVKWENGSDFEGSCWPGVSSYLDFLNPATRDYYADWYSYDKFTGSTPVLAGVWNDMNEPSVFDETIEKTLPFETLHYGNVPHRDIHNIYGFLQTMATHQGLMKRDNGTLRPFILTRSHFAGSQRYAALWTGDNTADWEYLQVSYSECILSNIVGHVFCGADVGGFFDDPTPELLQRWYQAAIWLPFYRGHSSEDSPRREPYLYNDTVQAVVRNAIKLRYKHIPVWYTLFYEHVRTGDPIVRPIFYEYPGTVDQTYHILIGSDILARPVMDKGAKSVNVSFPGKDTHWYRADDGNFQVYSGLKSQSFDVTMNTSPYFYKGGSIIARKDLARRNTEDMKDDPFTLYVNLDQNNEASGTLYVDDYKSFKYQDEGYYFYVNVTYNTNTDSVSFQTIDGEGEDFVVYIEKIIVHQISKKTGAVDSRRSVHTKLDDGTPIHKINIAEKVSKHKHFELKL